MKVAFWGVSERSGSSANMMAVVGAFRALHPELSVAMRRVRAREAVPCASARDQKESRGVSAMREQKESRGMSAVREQKESRGMSAMREQEKSCAVLAGPDEEEDVNADQACAVGKAGGADRTRATGKAGRASLRANVREMRTGRAQRQSPAICFIDCGSGLDAAKRRILGQADVAVANVRQDEGELERLFLGEARLLPDGLILIGDYLGHSKLCRCYLERTYRIGPRRLLTIPHSQEYDYACACGRARDFLEREGRSPKSLRSQEFFAELGRISELLIKSGEELYGEIPAGPRRWPKAASAQPNEAGFITSMIGGKTQCQ